MYACVVGERVSVCVRARGMRYGERDEGREREEGRGELREGQRRIRERRRERRCHTQVTASDYCCPLSFSLFLSPSLALCLPLALPLRQLLLTTALLSPSLTLAIASDHCCPLPHSFSPFPPPPFSLSLCLSQAIASDHCAVMADLRMYSHKN